jgi:hypothetical protein
MGGELFKQVSIISDYLDFCCLDWLSGITVSDGFFIGA